mmetsp:Transcript_10131/g.19990  ORF Transcript_10131/g.19990 Transcript_10131/m.19990 type:complete len:82 (+) Transcript_10131:1169-1414(+)
MEGCSNLHLVGNGAQEPPVWQPFEKRRAFVVDGKHPKLLVAACTSTARPSEEELVFVLYEVHPARARRSKLSQCLAKHELL